MAPESGGRLHGRAAIVTGGGGGIGSKIVRRLAAEGATVAVVDRDADSVEHVCAEAAADGFAVEGAVGDVIDPAFAHDVVSRTPEAPSVLVNGAARRTYRSVLELDGSFFEEHLALNTIAPALWVRELAQRLIDAGTGGSIVNITSIVAHRGFPLNAAYAASKAALLGYSRCAAVDLAPHGIRVNCVAPGPTRTPLTAELLGDEEALRSLEQRIPLRRVGEPDDIAGAVAFLASDDSAYVTGITIGVDGGYLVV